MLLRDQLFIGGAWVAPSGRETIEVHNAGNGQVMGRVPLGDVKDVERAVAAARSALDSWSATPPEQRSQFLEKISAGLKARADELARLIAQEVGMPLKMSARIQAGLPIANFANYAKLVKDFSFENRVGNSLVVRDPVGVVGGDHAVELPTAPDRAESRAGARRRLHRRAQALRGRAVQCFPPRGSHRGGRPAEGRVQPRHRHRRGGRRSAGEASGRRHDLVHRLDARRQAHLGIGFSVDQASCAGARRQERLRDPRRRRPRDRGEEHGQRLLSQFRADLHRPHAHARARVKI